LVAGGARVVVADLQVDRGRELVGELGSPTHFTSTDVTSPEQGAAAVRQAVERFGKLDGLISCAGILGGARIVGRDGPHDLATFEQVIRVNLIGVFNMMRLAADAMQQNEPNEDGERGVIINTSSVAAYEGQIGQAAYSASKGGVASMTLPAARELARLGIRVVAIAPGVFETAMMAATPDSLRESLLEQAPFPRRFGKPSEFAEFAQQIIENSMLNGSVLRLDGATRMGSK
jgi:NAD(P)-dependent dehydrogenase (short-subunit alcohol dehydrogenase family)